MTKRPSWLEEREQVARSRLARIKQRIALIATVATP
jgi:hypothetical protein